MKKAFPEFDEHEELKLLNQVDDLSENWTFTVDGSDTMNQYLTQAIEYHPLLLQRYIALLNCYNKLCDFMPEVDSVPGYIKADVKKAMDNVDKVFAKTK